MVNMVEEELKIEVRELIRAASITANIIPLQMLDVCTVKKSSIMSFKIDTALALRL